MRRSFAALLGVALTSVSLAGQQPSITRHSVPQQLTLEEAIAIALRNNAAYLRLLNDQSVNEAARRNAFSRMLPVPSASFSTGGGPSRNISTLGTNNTSNSSTSFSLGLSLNVWDGGATLNQYRQSRMQVESGIIGVASQEVTLRGNVAVQYFQTQQAERAVELEERLLERRKLELDDTRRKFEKAIVGQIEEERARIRVVQGEHTLQSAKDALEKAKLSLLGTLGISAGTEFTLVSPLPAFPDSVRLNADSIVQVALARNPQIRQQEISLEQNRMNNTIQRRSRFMPRVRLTASYGRNISEPGYSALFDPTARSQSMNGNFGFSFSFTELLDMPSTALRLRQSGASLEDAVISTRDLSIRIEREVKVAIIDLEAAYRNLALANLRVASSRLQVQVADVMLNANLINYFNYQQILDDASAAERDVLTQQLNVLSRRIALDQLLGTTPAFGGTGG